MRANRRIAPGGGIVVLDDGPVAFRPAGFNGAVELNQAQPLGKAGAVHGGKELQIGRAQGLRRQGPGGQGGAAAFNNSDFGAIVVTMQGHLRLAEGKAPAGCQAHARGHVVDHRTAQEQPRAGAAAATQPQHAQIEGSPRAARHGPAQPLGEQRQGRMQGGWQLRLDIDASHLKAELHHFNVLQHDRLDGQGGGLRRIGHQVLKCRGSPVHVRRSPGPGHASLAPDPQNAASLPPRTGAGCPAPWLGG